MLRLLYLTPRCEPGFPHIGHGVRDNLQILSILPVHLLNGKQGLIFLSAKVTTGRILTVYITYEKPNVAMKWLASLFLIFQVPRLFSRSEG
jgi:hypothetical protein